MFQFERHAFCPNKQRLKAEDVAESQDLGERLKEMKYHSLVKRNDCKECSFFLPLDTVLLLQVGCSSKKQRHIFVNYKVKRNQFCCAEH